MAAAEIALHRVFFVRWSEMGRWVLPTSAIMGGPLRKGWTTAKIGDVVRLVADRVQVNPDCEYKMAGVRWYGEGLFHRETVRGNKMSAKYVAVETRPAQMGDYVVSDLECTVDDKPIHKKRENLWVLLDKDSLVPGLHEKIAGMNKGEEKDIDVVLPEKYPDKLVAGKAARYHVKVKEIKERIPPNLDDELAKDLHRESLDALKKEIATELEHRTRLSIEVDMEN